MADPRPFNPLSKPNLANSIVTELLKRAPVPLEEPDRFDGAGVYAIYYVGDFAPYAPLSKANRNSRWRAPIYVGKASPKGGRKGSEILEEDDAAQVGPELWRRLKRHLDSIRDAKDTLDASDFFCRFLVIDEIWIALAESLLISHFAPVWNTLVDGFGNHDPGSGRYGSQKTRWDLVHPGRAWAFKCKDRAETPGTVHSEIEDYLKSRSFSHPSKLYGR